MKKYCLPLENSRPFFPSGDQQEKLLLLSRQAEQWKKEPSVHPHEWLELLHQTYALAETCLDQKQRALGSLLPAEQDIRLLCRRECQKGTRPHLQTEEKAAEKLLALLGELRRWFGLLSEEEAASHCLTRAGAALLPGYTSKIQPGFSKLASFFQENVGTIAFQLLAGQLKAALLYQRSCRLSETDWEKAFRAQRYCQYAYSGQTTAFEPTESPLPIKELPECLRPLYKEESGILQDSSGLQAWIGKAKTEICLAFSGTKITNPAMVWADIRQLSAPSLLYLRGAGLLCLLAQQQKPLFTAGHSLGGGVTMFSLAAQPTPSPMNGIALNPAGLSLFSLNYLPKDGLEQSVSQLQVFRTAKDPVSAFGGKLGCVTTLPPTGRDGHSLQAVFSALKQAENSDFQGKNGAPADFYSAR